MVGNKVSAMDDKLVSENKGKNPLWLIFRSLLTESAHVAVYRVNI